MQYSLVNYSPHCMLHPQSFIYLLTGSLCLLTAAAAAAKSLQSCPTLCDPIDGSPPGSPVPGILQARILEWVAISFSSAWKWKMKVAQLYPTPSDPTDCSLPGFSGGPWDFPGERTGVGSHCLLTAFTHFAHPITRNVTFNLYFCSKVFVWVS